LENQRQAVLLQEQKRKDAAKKIKEVLSSAEKIGNFVITSTRYSLSGD
jgi:hypothetical protein